VEFLTELLILDLASTWYWAKDCILLGHRAGKEHGTFLDGAPLNHHQAFMLPCYWADLGLGKKKFRSCHIPFCEYLFGIYLACSGINWRMCYF